MRVPFVEEAEGGRGIVMAFVARPRCSVVIDVVGGADLADQLGGTCRDSGQAMGVVTIQAGVRPRARYSDHSFSRN
ncbi:hypothetical protein KRM28CT15_10640 [Krasilnikovia sp. M28-CT-15]